MHMAHSTMLSWGIFHDISWNRWNQIKEEERNEKVTSQWRLGDVNSFVLKMFFYFILGNLLLHILHERDTRLIKNSNAARCRCFRTLLSLVDDFKVSSLQHSERFKILNYLFITSVQMARNALTADLITNFNINLNLFINFRQDNPFMLGKTLTYHCVSLYLA